MGEGEESEAQITQKRFQPTSSHCIPVQLTAGKERIQLWVSEINSSSSLCYFPLRSPSPQNWSSHSPALETPRGAGRAGAAVAGLRAAGGGEAGAAAAASSVRRGGGCCGCGARLPGPLQGWGEGTGGAAAKPGSGAGILDAALAGGGAGHQTSPHTRAPQQGRSCRARQGPAC